MRRLAVLFMLLPASLLAQAQPVPQTAAKPGWKWTMDSVTAVVNEVRAGRSLQPKVWPNGARVAALLSFNAEGELDSAVEAMTSARLGVSTGEVTKATRSIQIDGVDVREGQFIGLIDGVLSLSGDTLNNLVKDLLWRMHVTDRELVTLYYGADRSPAEAEALTGMLRETYPAQEFEVFEGGQPHYFYILSVE